MKDENYLRVYKSKTTNATIRVKNRPSIKLIAKAVIKLAESHMATDKGKHNGKI